MTVSFQIYTPDTPVTLSELAEIVSFLHEQLEQYGDPIPDITKCAQYAMSDGNHPGGAILTARERDQLIGAVIVNKTGMDGYIPGNILVYIAIHKAYRGRGLGSKLMQQVVENTQGDIALHVEPENPAKKLYERLGFTNKYLEMRWKRA